MLTIVFTVRTGLAIIHNLVNVLLYNRLDPTLLAVKNSEINVDFASEDATLPQTVEDQITLGLVVH